jgi:hypothetical protein
LAREVEERPLDDLEQEDPLSLLLDLMRARGSTATSVV